jgi:hypothetical protein
MRSRARRSAGTAARSKCRKSAPICRKWALKPKLVNPQIGAALHLPGTTAILKGIHMSRLKTYGLALALLASAALTSACTKMDTTGPSDQPQASFEEGQGAHN